MACKAARVNWSTTTMIVRNRPGCPPATQRELDQCVAIHESLLLSVAQWTIRFGSDRILAKKNERAANAPAEVRTRPFNVALRYSGRAAVLDHQPEWNSHLFARSDANRARQFHLM